MIFSDCLFIYRFFVLIYYIFSLSVFGYNLFCAYMLKFFWGKGEIKYCKRNIKYPSSERGVCPIHSAEIFVVFSLKIDFFQS